ncbi:NucA/NucB deoxyribonuclease domain-containing protein [Saccharopolyspora shandongensis]|uniref:NucA/NucB deoxyribonuclease domain-containing protein n=1 Tax=Saccharopolyspora shandongensis TaxID=418495 RepID=UPI0033C07283
MLEAALLKRRVLNWPGEAQFRDQIPERTFPSLLGKNAPGRSVDDPLERLMAPERRRKNHDAAVKICVDVWGKDYAQGGMECDEYPFQSTYQGAAESTGDQPFSWHGSARPIPRADNGTGGTLLANFYGRNRVLDKDRFYVTAVP